MIKNVQNIIDTANILDIVSGFVDLRRRGSGYLGLCPFHNEKTPSFHVSPAKNIFKCFGCGKAGDSVTFLREHELFTFPEALRYIANKYNILIEEDEKRDESEEVYDLLAKENEGYKKTPIDYFRKRGISPEMIQKFELGYATSGFFRGRAIFPIHNLYGKIVGFGGRSLTNEKPKYINSEESSIYHKSKTLYGAYFAKKAIQQLDECILVEGYTDVISLHQKGIENVVASSGTSLTADQIKIIRRFTQNVTILYDGDDAGMKATQRAIEALITQDMNVKVATLPNGQDPDSCPEVVRHIKEAVNFADWMLRDLGEDPDQRARAIRAIYDLVYKMPDPVKRAVYIQNIIQKTKVSANKQQKVKISPRTMTDEEYVAGVLAAYGDILIDDDTVAEYISSNLDITPLGGPFLEPFDLERLIKAVIRLKMKQLEGIHLTDILQKIRLRLLLDQLFIASYEKK